MKKKVYRGIRHFYNFFHVSIALLHCCSASYFRYNRLIDGTAESTVSSYTFDFDFAHFSCTQCHFNGANAFAHLSL